MNVSVEQKTHFAQILLIGMWALDASAICRFVFLFLLFQTPVPCPSLPPVPLPISLVGFPGSSKKPQGRELFSTGLSLKSTMAFRHRAESVNFS